MAILNKTDLYTMANAKATTDSNYVVEQKFIYYPLKDYKSNTYKLASAYVMHHTDAENAKEHTTVIAHTGNNEYYLWCGDRYLTGGIDNEEAEERMVFCTNELPEENKEFIISQMRLQYAALTANTGCNNKRFLSNLEHAMEDGKSVKEICESNTLIVCKHIQNMFAQMDDNVTKTLEKMYKEAHKVNKNAKSDSAINDALDNFGFQGEAVFIAGPGGHGKTRAVKDYAEKNELNFVELQGHGQIEAIDMYGYDKKFGDQMVWFDGPISQAARAAANGVKTLLFIDEFVNIPMRETAGLKASFEPYKGHYYFQTSRITSIEDGIAVMEEIKVPVANLQIVAAANIGAGYASEDIDKALKQRFMILYYEAEDAKVRSVLLDICKNKGYNIKLVDKLMNFKKLMEMKVAEGLIDEAPVMRHLTRKFLELMKDEDDLEYVATTQMLQFVEFDVDGKPVAEQVEAVKEIIDATLVG